MLVAENHSAYICGIHLLIYINKLGLSRIHVRCKFSAAKFVKATILVFVQHQWLFQLKKLHIFHHILSSSEYSEALIVAS